MAWSTRTMPRDPEIYRRHRQSLAYARRRERVRAQNKIASQAHRARLRLAALERLCPELRCSCGESRPECLVFHHVHGGGPQHRMVAGKAQQFYRWVLAAPLAEVQHTLHVLCRNCHLVLHAKERAAAKATLPPTLARVPRRAQRVKL